MGMLQQDRKDKKSMSVCIITEACVPRSKVCCKALHRLCVAVRTRSFMLTVLYLQGRSFGAY